MELARIGRRWTETVNSVRQLRERGIRIRSLLLLGIFWCAGQELKAIRRRTRAGLDRARAKGVKLGRPWAGPPEMRDLALKMRQCARMGPRMGRSPRR